MKISELIEKLKVILDEHGDLPVYHDIDITYIEIETVEHRIKNDFWTCPEHVEVA